MKNNLFISIPIPGEGVARCSKLNLWIFVERIIEDFNILLYSFVP